jgi:hypothetical protein
VPGRSLAVLLDEGVRELEVSTLVAAQVMFASPSADLVAGAIKPPVSVIAHRDLVRGEALVGGRGERKGTMSDVIRFQWTKARRRGESGLAGGDPAP